MGSGRFATIQIAALVILSALALAVACLAAMIATPLTRPPVLISVNEDGAALARADLPPVSRIQARDGTDLAFRRYAAATASPRAVAILIHGSSASNLSMSALAMALAMALAARNIVVYALDVRGHGHSGMRGDIAYLGQLTDDMADIVAMVRAGEPERPLLLIGHSAGGGFALQVAASPEGAVFDAVVLLAPYLGYGAPTSRTSSGWDSADIPRVLALDFLNELGITCCNGLPTLAFAVPDYATARLTPAYSYRLMRSFAVSGNARAALARSPMPIRIYAGENDEVMDARMYPTFVGGFGPRVTASVLAGLRHMTILDSPQTVDAIMRDLAPIIDKPML